MKAEAPTKSAAPTPPPPRDLHDVVETITRGYLDPDSPVNHLGQCELPSRSVTIQIHELVKDVLFPDHRMSRKARRGRAEEEVAGLVEDIHEMLRRQIHLARTYEYDGDGECPHTLDQADADAMAFIRSLPRLREALALDVQAALDGDPAAHSKDEIIFCYPGFEAVTAYRVAHELHALGVPLLPRIITESAHSATGADIHPGADIGASFFIDHATGVVIGETTEIGERVKLYQGVTLGALSIPRDAQGKILRRVKRHPTIEDDVVIYAGATVLGGETVIGRGAVIGGSCWITQSIPAGTKVVLQDPQMRMRGPKGVEESTVEFVANWDI